jgi:phage portal protein BeeE
LTGGAKFTPISLKPADIAWLDARKFGIAEVARIFRVPPFMIGVNEAGSVSYASTEQASIYFVQHTIRPYLEQIESSYQRILPRGATGLPTFLRFNVDGLLRGDVASRYTAYATGIQHGFLRVADVRTLEDLPPLDDTSLESLRPLSLAPANIADVKTKVETLGALIRAGFEPASALEAVGLESIAHTGSVPVTVQAKE